MSCTPLWTRADINKDVPVETALVGDAGLILDGLVEAVRERSRGASEERTAAITEEIRTVKSEWLEQWMPKLTSDAVPMTPYRVIWDLLHTVDVKNTIITHDAGSPRDQMSPFWAVYRTIDLHRLGKDDAARLRARTRYGCETRQTGRALCVNVWGDAVNRFHRYGFRDGSP